MLELSSRPGQSKGLFYKLDGVGFCLLVYLHHKGLRRQPVEHHCFPVDKCISIKDMEEIISLVSVKPSDEKKSPSVWRKSFPNRRRFFCRWLPIVAATRI